MKAFASTLESSIFSWVERRLTNDDRAAVGNYAADVLPVSKEPAVQELAVPASKEPAVQELAVPANKELAMRLRIRQNVVQLVRTEYDAETKKPKAIVVGRLRRAKPELDDELKKALSAEEITEVEQWGAREQRLQALKEEVASLSLPESMALAEQWFTRMSAGDDTRRLADQVVASWQRLRQQMKQNGLIE